MYNLSNKTICLFGYGNFYYVAQKLAQTYGRVLYCLPWQTAFPKYNQYIVGQGVPGVERIDSIWPYFDQIDIFYFEDLFQGDFQEWLRAQGKLVFGAGKGENLEIYRDSFKELQKELGMSLNPYEVIKGVELLREHLKNKRDVFIKTNMMRGNMETFHWDSYELSKPILDELQHSLGAYQNEITFIAEQPIANAVEYGYDGFVIMGQYPAKTIFGIEVKDAAYAGVAIDYEKLPKPVKEANEKLAPIFQAYNYRGAFSSEMRATSRSMAILSDMTTRNPEPPTSLMIEMLADYGFYVWLIANGVIPEIEAKGKYGVQVIIKSDWAKTEPQAIYFPEENKDFVKIKNLAIIDGVHYYIPQNIEMEEIGAVVAWDDTLKGAIRKVKKVAETVKGYCIKCNCDALDAAQEEISKLADLGVNVF